MHPLAKIQKEFEALYGLDLGRFRVTDFIREEEEIEEGLILRKESNGDLSIALCFGKNLLNGFRGFWRTPLETFCTVIEGVSHWFMVVCRAASGRPVSQLELELQAEVDKFLFCLLYFRNRISTAQLRSLLFGSYRLLPDLSDEQRERYELANRLAFRYCESLDRWSHPSHRQRLIQEARRFRRLALEEKIRQAA